MALKQTVQQSALEQQALNFFLQEEEREKEELKQALKVASNKGKQFYEVVVYILHT